MDVCGRCKKLFRDKWLRFWYLIYFARLVISYNGVLRLLCALYNAYNNAFVAVGVSKTILYYTIF